MEGKGLAFTPRQVGNECVLATNDIYCVHSSQYRHLNQYKVQVRGYEHIFCNVVANAMIKHNSPGTHGQHISATCDDPRVLEWVRHDTTPVVTAGSTVCSGQQVGSIESSHSQAEVSSQSSKPEAMDKKADSTVISNPLILFRVLTWSTMRDTRRRTLLE